MAFIIADRVKETTTTTGTGALTLAGTLTGFTTFAARCAVGDTLYYAIQAVDGAGAPTGEWECGLGTYSGTSTLTRTTVTSSSNADAAVSFAAGTKQVFITMPAVQVRWTRERLTAPRTYFVRSDGNDTNTGLANTAGGAFLTIQRAVDVASATDAGGFAVTIQIADGTYTGANVLKPLLDNSQLSIVGNEAAPGNVIISVTGATAFSASVGGLFVLAGMRIQTTTSGSGVFVSGGGSRVSGRNLNFGACSAAHIYLNSNGAWQTGGAITISGASGYFIYAETGGVAGLGGHTYTAVGTPAFANAFVWFSEGAACSAFTAVWSGAVTGTRYRAQLNGVINTYGAGADHFPGSVAGTIATGGQYA